VDNLSDILNQFILFYLFSPKIKKYLGETMEPIILFRKGLEEEGEIETAQEYFPVVFNRTKCKDNFVICRYSALPFHKELEEDLAFSDIPQGKPWGFGYATLR
jgi:hypothetical protein